MTQALEFLKKNWRVVLIGLAALFVLWAFTPNWATRSGMEAAAEAKAAVERANEHKERADAAQEASVQEATKRIQMQADLDRITKEKEALAVQVVQLTKALPPRPKPSANPTPTDDLVQQLYTVVDKQAALIAKQEEEGKKQDDLIESLKASEAKFREAAEVRAQETEELRRALRAKELQVDAMKWAGIKDQARAGVVGAILWEVLRSAVLRKR